MFVQRMHRRCFDFKTAVPVRYIRNIVNDATSDSNAVSTSLSSRDINEIHRPGVPATPFPDCTESQCQRPPKWREELSNILERHDMKREWSEEELDAAMSRNTMFTWGATNVMATSAIKMAKGDGVYFIDTKGKRYIDWNSQAMCVNLGHSMPQSVQDAITEQMRSLPYAYPGISCTPIRAKLCQLLSEISPGDLNTFMFPSSGSEANEAAVRMSRLYTGRQKIFARYRSYHGATNGSMSLTGEFRRWTTEPNSMPGIIHFFDPYPYSFSWGETEEEITMKNLTALREQLKYEGTHKVAAIFIESITGTNGVLKPPRGYLEGIRSICDEYGILLICDEVMAGFGRSGRLFGFCHAPTVIPDMFTFAKGVNGAFLPLGGVGMRDHVADFFRTHPIGYGSTYNGHPISLASAYAVIQEILKRDLIGHAAKMEEHMIKGFEFIQSRHPSVRTCRVIGLFGTFEVQKNVRGDYISEIHEPLHPAMVAFKQALLDSSLFTMIRGHMVFCNPPLIVTPEQIKEGFDIIDRNLYILDNAMED